MSFLVSSDGAQQSYSWEFPLLANTWTKITRSFPGNSNLTFDDNTGLGVMFDMGMFWGTNYTSSSAPLNQWGAYITGQRCRDFDATWGNTTNATFDVTGVQLEVGSNATPFEHESYGQTLTKCQRYYEVHGTQLDTAQNGSGTGYATWNFKQTKRVTPSSASDTGGIFTGTNVLSSTGWQIYGSASAVRMTVNAFVSSEI